MKRNLRLDVKVRKRMILKEGIKIAVTEGLVVPDLSLSIAKSLGITRSLVLTYFPAKKLQEEIIKYAIKHEIDNIIVEAVVLRYELALNLDKKIIKKAFANYMII